MGSEELTMDHIYDICALKFKEHVIYCRALEDFDNLRKAHKIMNLSNPMLDDQEKDYILNEVSSNFDIIYLDEVVDFADSGNSCHCHPSRIRRCRFG
jgi:hypothetical protein